MKNLNFGIFNSYFCANLNLQMCIMDECFIFSKGIVIFFFLLSCYLLYNKFNLMFIFFIGCIFNAFVNIILKLLI